MRTSLENLLSGQKPRESSGADTDKRFNFQKDYSLFLMLDLHARNTDYVLLFDFFDDLILIDSEKAPSSVSFYQIKTKRTGHWSLSSLLKKDNGKLSILGKLYFNKLQFSDYTTSLNFISNAQFKLPLLDKVDSLSKAQINGFDLDTKGIKKVNAQIKDEHSLTDDISFETITFFKVTDLSLNDSQTHCTGALSKLINLLSPGAKVNADLAYKHIFSEIKRKTDCIVTEISVSSFTEIIEKKGISRSQFDEILKIVGVYKNYDDVWKQIESRFTIEGLTPFHLRPYKKAWRDLEIALIDKSNNSLVTDTYRRIISFAKQQENDPAFMNLPLHALVNAIYSMIPGDFKPMQFNEYFIKSIILREIYND